MIKKISGNIQMVFTEDGFTTANCVLITDSTRLMIDSGAGSMLKDTEPEKADILLCSHHHLDHIQGNDQFINAEIYAHPIEKDAMQSPDKTAATDGWEALMDGDVLSHAKELGSLENRFLEGWRVDKPIENRQIFDCGKTEIMAIHTPGHTAGHMCFLFTRENFIFTADICLTQAGPWYGDPDTEIDDFIKSVDLVRDLKPERLATGHLQNILSENIDDTLTKYRDRVYKREKRIFESIKNNPCDIHELADRKLIYAIHPTTFVLFWEKAMLIKHIERLIKNGSIEKIENSRYRAVTGDC